MTTHHIVSQCHHDHIAIVALSQDLNTWWADEKVSSLELSAPLSILPSVTVEQAIDIMVQEGFDQLPVITESGKIVGVATMGSLKAKLLKVTNDHTHIIALTYLCTLCVSREK